MNQNTKWISAFDVKEDVCPKFLRNFSLKKALLKASLEITATGLYEASINGKRVGDFVLAPGWTVYAKRLQVQTYDVTDLIHQDNELTVLLGKGWYHGPIMGWQTSEAYAQRQLIPAGIKASLKLVYADGTEEDIFTDEEWQYQESSIRFSEIYDGEIYDATFVPDKTEAVHVFDGPDDTLIPQVGEPIREIALVMPQRLFTTPAGDTVIDFGQEFTGYIRTSLSAKAGEVISLSFGEMLDKDGNFYNENYRSAKSQYIYTCRDGFQTYAPHFTFYSFRYVRVDRFPGEINLDAFTGVVVCSDMKRTGFLRSSDPMLNQLFDNIIWGQRCNFVDVPTDCPQRDERCGWTGDAEVFIRTASLNYDTERFYTKWLGDLMADQREDGFLPHVCPNTLNSPEASAAWGDAGAICPFELYQAFGNLELLRTHYPMMVRWVGYITSHTTVPYLWMGGVHYGDWLGLDAPGYASSKGHIEDEWKKKDPSDSYRGASRDDFVASAYYAYSTELTIRAGKILGEDTSELEALYANIIKAFRKTFPTYTTQTECVLAAHFHLAEDPQAAADQLATMVKNAGVRLQTGFVGTPYILWVLTKYGYNDLAYQLLLRREFPGWLYPITKGATTIWEHWDGVKPDGSFWSVDMNSFNHYAYGSVADWVYQVALGITPEEPGYAKVRIAPHPDASLDALEGTLETRHGKIHVRWEKTTDGFRYDIMTPTSTRIIIGEKIYEVGEGSYRFYS